MATKLLKYTWLILTFSILPLSAVLAQKITIDNPLKATSFDDLIDSIINFLYRLSLVVVPLMVIIAGIFFIIGGGDPNKIKQARNIILYTIVGFAIILLAKSIVAIIKDILEVR